MKTKKCITCGQIKTLDNFYKQIGRKAMNQCRECRKEWQKEYNRKRAESMEVNHTAILSSDESIDQWLKEHPINRQSWRDNARLGYKHEFNNRTVGV